MGAFARGVASACFLVDDITIAGYLQVPRRAKIRNTVLEYEFFWQVKGHMRMEENLFKGNVISLTQRVKSATGRVEEVAACNQAMMDRYGTPDVLKFDSRP